MFLRSTNVSKFLFSLIRLLLNWKGSSFLPSSHPNINTHTACSYGTLGKHRDTQHTDTNTMFSLICTKEVVIEGGDPKNTYALFSSYLFCTKTLNRAHNISMFSSGPQL